MKRVTIITFLAVLLCALAACGSTQVGSTGGDTVFIFDGVDTWVDENGVEWNKTVR